MDTLLDPANPDVRVEFDMAEAEVAQRAQWRAAAATFHAIDKTLREAVRHPEVFVRTERLSTRDAVEFAQRSAAADLAVRLNLTEAAVRSQGHVAATLRERVPSVWAWFREGDVSTQNAGEAASLVADLPEEHWMAFDAALVEPAKVLAPPRFRARARAIREKLFACEAVERHERALQARGVWSEQARDGMGWLNAHLSSDQIALAQARIDEMAFGLLKADDEVRTMQQLRADVFADLLTGREAGASGVTVALTVPVMTLLGQSTEPAVLEGVGPIDIETARELCVSAPSLTRLLTDPIKGTVLAMDPDQYRPNKALKRWLAQRDVTCTFPGCGRRAANCDVDHVVDWALGGATTADNLAHLCRKHHTMKHSTRWRVTKPPGQTPVWTSPTGFVRSEDPPPF
ncbi:HNH endonuclease signature motif containing protein [soil metagenome]